MTVKQAAERLEVSSATVYGLVAAGRLRCHRVGLGRGVIRISEEQVADFLKAAERGRVMVPPPPPAAPVSRPRLRHLRVD